MAESTWAWAGACSTGTSHIKNGCGCDDAAACVEVLQGNGKKALIVVVSDGAGSARFASLGSRLVVRGFVQTASRFLRQGGKLSEIGCGLGRSWIDGIRDQLGYLAKERSGTLRDFAATLIAVIVDDGCLVVFHIGDGACVVRREGATHWEVPSWPAHGEYASSTFFVTDDPEPQLRLDRIDGHFGQVAVFSDGIERLSLDFAQLVPSNRFFDPMFQLLADRPAGRNRALSSSLRTFLDGPSVTDRTDDDKTLIIARRSVTQ